MITGRIPEYPNNEIGLEKFIELSDRYMAAVRENGTVPSVAEWCEITGITRVTLLNYEKNRPLYSHAIAMYKEKISEQRAKAYSATFNRKLSQEQKNEFC